MTTREDLHHLIDELPESELSEARRRLQEPQDGPASDALTRLLDSAPENDEPLTPEDEAAIEEGWAAYRRGETRSWQEVRRELAGETTLRLKRPA